MINIVLIAFASLGFMMILLLYKHLVGGSRETKQGHREQGEVYQIDYLVNYVKEAINDLTRTNIYDLGLSEENFTRRLNKRSALKSALKNCTYGSSQDKEYVKDFIGDLLSRGCVTKEKVDRIIPFDRPGFLTVQDQFEVLLYLYRKQYGYDGLAKLLTENGLDRLKSVLEDGQVSSYIVTADEVKEIYLQRAPLLTYEDKLAIITQRVYQAYKGFGVVDEIRDMNIDGVSGGVSGIVDSTDIDYFTSGQGLGSGDYPRTYESVWVFFQGKAIHLSFLSFGSDNELKRVCQNIYRYNKAGQLSEQDGYKVSEMKDGSRVVVVRPTFSESWAFFVRKFHIADLRLEELIKDEGCHLPNELLKYLVKGARITSVTGAQGSGKTTLLMAMVRHVYGTLTLRVQEMSFELHLRKVYPMRNILSFKETRTVSGQAGLDLQKKTDGAVSILGEVATDEVAVWMLQMAQVASMYTLFTHHAKSIDDLVMSLRNSLLKTEVFRDEKVAESQVVNVIDFDVHLEKDESGRRFISRITEIEALDVTTAYPTNYKDLSDKNDRMAAFMDTMTTFFERRTDRATYKVRNVVEFKEGRYITKDDISQQSLERMLRQMTPEDGLAFKGFIETNWGHQL